MESRIMKRSDGPYSETIWRTGQLIAQSNMKNIEDWLASATDELFNAREGFTIRHEPNEWNTVGERLNYITDAVTLMIPDGAAKIINDLQEETKNLRAADRQSRAATAATETAILEAQTATTRANSAAELIENMTVAAQTLSAGAPASIIKWEASNDKYELELGIPVPTFTTSTTTTYDGSTAASVTVDNSNNLSRNLAFSIPVPKFTVQPTSTIVSGNISDSASVVITDNNTLNPKLKFNIPAIVPTASVTTKTSGTIEAAVNETGNSTLTPNFDFTIPVVTPQKGTVTTRNTGAVNSANLFTLTDINTLTPKLNFEIPVQQIKGVTYAQATPGTSGSFTIDNTSILDPTLTLTVPVQNFSEVTATPLAAGANPTASIEHINDLNLRLNLGLPLAKPIDVVKTYSSVAELQANIRNDVAVGYYAIVASSEKDEDNGKIYLRTNTAPDYYSFIADIAAATPYFHMGTMNVADVNTTKAATIDITDPTQPILNLTIPAIPVINSNINMNVVDADKNSSATISGAPTNTTLNLTIPAIPVFEQNVNMSYNAGDNPTASITGTADDLTLNLNFPPDTTSAPATASTRGTVKIGDTLTYNRDGTINVKTATTTSKGIIQVGTGLKVNDGVVRIDSELAPSSSHMTKFLPSSAIYFIMPILVEFTGISSLPTSFSVPTINSQMVVAYYELSNPSAFTSDITVETSGDETVTLSGSMLSGATSDIKITFIVPRSVTPTTAEQIQE